MNKEQKFRILGLANRIKNSQDTKIEFKCEWFKTPVDGVVSENLESSSKKGSMILLDFMIGHDQYIDYEAGLDAILADITDFAEKDSININENEIYDENGDISAYRIFLGFALKTGTSDDHIVALDDIEEALENLGAYDLVQREGKVTESSVEIPVEHEGILEVPEGKKVDELPLKHFEDLVDKKGYDAIIKALNNLKVWNKNDDKQLSNWANDTMDKLREKFRPENSSRFKRNDRVKDLDGNDLRILDIIKEEGLEPNYFIEYVYPEGHEDSYRYRKESELKPVPIMDLVREESSSKSSWKVGTARDLGSEYRFPVLTYGDLGKDPCTVAYYEGKYSDGWSTDVYNLEVYYEDGGAEAYGADDFNDVFQHLLEASNVRELMTIRKPNKKEFDAYYKAVDNYKGSKTETSSEEYVIIDEDGKVLSYLDEYHVDFLDTVDEPDGGYSKAVKFSNVKDAEQSLINIYDEIPEDKEIKSVKEAFAFVDED